MDKLFGDVVIIVMGFGRPIIFIVFTHGSIHNTIDTVLTYKFLCKYLICNEKVVLLFPSVYNHSAALCAVCQIKIDCKVLDNEMCYVIVLQLI